MGSVVGSVVQNKYSWWERISVSTEERTARTAQAAAKALQNLPRCFPQQAERSSLYASLRNFSKEAACYKEDSRVQDFEREFWAYKLGVSAQALQNNAAFFDWAKKIRLDKQLSHYGHSLQESSGTIQIWQNGKHVSWQPNLLSPVPQVAGSPNLYSPPRHYDATGIVSRNYYDWRQPAPYKTETPRSENIVELCVLAEKQGKLRFSGDHSWIRIKAKNGDIYSFGLYREDNDFKTASVSKGGFVQSPDISEFWPEEPSTLSVAIDDQKMQTILAYLAGQKQKRFQLQEENCTTFALDVMKMAGIELSARTTVFTNFIPGPLYWGALRCKKALPVSLQSVADKVWAVVRYPLDVLGSLFIVTLGARSGNQPLFESWLDIFKPSKHKMDAPYILAWQTIPEVEEARKGVGPYDIPAQFKA